MPEQRLKFEYLDQDSELRMMQPGASRYILNCRVGSAADGNRGAIETVKGNVLVSFALPAGNNFTIGTCEEKESNAVYYFLYNSSGNHSILRYQTDVQSVFQWSGLNFSLSHKITGTAFINGILYWTDNYNPPRRINVQRALSGEYETIKLTEQEFLNILVPAPVFPLVVSKERAGNRTLNYVAGQCFQFAYRFKYIDNEYSVLSPASKLLPVAREKNSIEEGLNRVNITLSQHLVISEQVKKIEYFFRTSNTDTWKGFTTTERNADGIFPAQLYFYNDTVSYTLDTASAAKPFESVPNTALALTGSDNRLMLGNYIEGYEQPVAGLRAELVTIPVDSTTGTIGSAPFDTAAYTWRRNGVRYYYANGTWVHVASGAPTAKYYFQYSNSLYYLGTLNTSTQVIEADITSQTGHTLAQLEFIWKFSGPMFGIGGGGLVSEGTKTFQRTDVPPAEETQLEKYRTFKSNSSYQIGILFKDYAGRHAGVSKGIATAMTDPLPDIIRDINAYIHWTIYVDEMEIPLWATHYHIVRTRNKSTTTFIQGVTADVVYAREDRDAPAGLAFSYIYRSGYDFVLLDISTLIPQGIGYVFAQGDYIRLTIGEKQFEMPIINQFGKYIAVPLQDFGPFNSSTPDNNLRFEIYTPYKSAEDEAFYEIGEVFPIINPGTPEREYSQFEGIIDGDCYMVSRKWFRYPEAYDIHTGSNDLQDFGDTIYVETSSPNDRYYSSWESDLGRIAPLLNNATAVHKKNAIRFSNPLIQGAQLNGLCEFEALNEYLLPMEHGGITALMPTNNVLVALQELEATSIYVGKSEITDTQGQTLISVSEKVLGSNRTLAGGYGCQHPETVQEYNGYLYWLDMNKGAVLRYAGNGVTDISAYFMSSYFKRKAAAYRASAYILASGFDVLNNEYLLTLGDETVAFHESPYEDLKRWVSFYSFVPELYACAGNSLLSFYDGMLYRHESNDVPRRTFKGNLYPAVIAANIQEQPHQVKVLQRLRLEAEEQWAVPVINNPEGQESELIPEDFEIYEGQCYAGFLRDKHSGGEFPLFEGDEMRSTNFTMRLEYSGSGTGKLLAANVGYVLSNNFNQ